MHCSSFYTFKILPYLSYKMLFSEEQWVFFLIFLMLIIPKNTQTAERILACCHVKTNAGIQYADIYTLCFKVDSLRNLCEFDHCYSQIH